MRLQLSTMMLAALLAGGVFSRASDEPDASAPLGVETATQMLSGTGPSDAVPWRFRCDDGAGCGDWTTIPVPSNWELQGFGRYDYGYRDDKRPEAADYALRFAVPDAWRGRRIELVFEGVMTDAAVTLNDHPLGTHQGGFTPFRFEVTDHLAFGAANRLAVHVEEASADPSVNRAERDADYWVFGGIYRPVYLEAHPPAWMRHVAVDARQGGHLRARVEVVGAEGSVRVEAIVRGMDGAPGGGRLSGQVGEDAVVELAGNIDGIVPWSAEQPVRYALELELSVDGELVHRLSRTIGFRTIEVRSDGLYVNRKRVLLKGINRHSFWPSTGRALDREQNRRDVELIKDLNANAVRASHYPPDRAFLEACDQLGLYVIDELPGWKQGYDTPVGRRLVAEMVRRDAHHPSVILWANGNEGGWNEALDGDFALHDLAQRTVIHPEERFGGFDTVHYPTWRELRDHLAGRRGWRALFFGSGEEDLVMPTEMLHGLYDGGGAAGLEAFWQLIRQAPRGAGGFLWALLDEGVERVDQGRRIDTAGSDAPDGVVSPWRDPEPSFAAIRRIWSPIVLDEQQLLGRPKRGDSVALRLHNRFDHTGLEACTFRYRWATIPRPVPLAGEAVRVATTGPVTASTTASVLAGPVAGPGTSGWLRVPVPVAGPADILALEAFDPSGRPVAHWSLPTVRRAVRVRTLVAGLRQRAAIPNVLSIEEDEHRFILRAGEVRVVIDGGTGRLEAMSRGDRILPLGNGPRVLGGDDGPVIAEHPSVEVNGVSLELGRRGALGRLRWYLDRSGWLRMSYLLEDAGRGAYLGLAFDIDEPAVESVTWFGRLEPVWANRPFGSPLAVHRMGIGRGSGATAWRAGYYDEVYWARIEGGPVPFVVAIEDDDLFLGIGTPVFAESSRTAVADVPRETLSFMHRIAGIGTKFHRPGDLEAAAERGKGLSNGALWLFIPEPDGGPP